MTSTAVDDYIIEPALAERLPLEGAVSMELLPLVRLDDKTVLVGVAEPLRSDKIDFLRHLTGAVTLESASWRIDIITSRSSWWRRAG